MREGNKTRTRPTKLTTLFFSSPLAWKLDSIAYVRPSSSSVLYGAEEKIKMFVIYDRNWLSSSYSRRRRKSSESGIDRSVRQNDVSFATLSLAAGKAFSDRYVRSIHLSLRVSEWDHNYECTSLFSPFFAQKLGRDFPPKNWGGIFRLSVANKRRVIIWVGRRVN